MNLADFLSKRLRPSKRVTGPWSLKISNTKKPIVAALLFNEYEYITFAHQKRRVIPFRVRFEIGRDTGEITLDRVIVSVKDYYDGPNRMLVAQKIQNEIFPKNFFKEAA